MCDSENYAFKSPKKKHTKNNCSIEFHHEHSRFQSKKEKNRQKQNLKKNEKK